MYAADLIHSTPKPVDFFGGVLPTNFTQQWDPNLFLECDSTQGVEPPQVSEFTGFFSHKLESAGRVNLHGTMVGQLTDEGQPSIEAIMMRHYCYFIIDQVPDVALVDIAESLAESLTFFLSRQQAITSIQPSPAFPLTRATAAPIQISPGIAFDEG